MLKKIVFLHLPGFLNYGGAERVLAQVANNLIYKNYDVSIISYTIESNSIYKLDNKIKRLELGYTPKSNLLYKIKYFIINVYRIRKILKTNNFQYLISLGSNATIISIFSSLYIDIKVINWIHYSYYADKTVKNIFLRNFFKNFCYKFLVLNKTDYKLYQNIYNNKVFYLPNPIPFKSENRSNLDNKKIISVGRITKVKGFNLLLEIVNLIVNKYNIKNYTFEIYGSSDFDNEVSILNNIINKYKLNSYVYIKEPTPNIKEIYLNSDIYLLTSFHECLPLVLLEAQECGLPIISFDINSGPKDIIIHNQNGFLIEPFNIEEYAKMLKVLIEDKSLRIKFGSNAIKTVQRYDIKNIINLWSELLK